MLRAKVRKWALSRRVFNRVSLVAALLPAAVYAGGPAHCTSNDQCLPMTTPSQTTPPGTGNGPEVPPSGSNESIPEFQMPAPMTLPQASPELNSTASTFGGSLQSGLMAASSYAPAMLGDAFGAGSPTTVTIPVFTPAQTVNFQGTLAHTGNNGFLDPTNSQTPIPFDLSAGPNGLGKLTLNTGDYTPGTVPSDPNFYSTGPITGTPTGFPVQENSSAQQFIRNNLTASNQPQPVDIVYNGGQASQIDPNTNPNQYKVYQDYTLVYVPAMVDPNAVGQVVVLPGGSIASTPGADVGRIKLSENVSPIPRDRVYVNYSYFDNTPLYQGGVNVNRVTPGFEKT